jgi:hypothetical protein
MNARILRSGFFGAAAALLGAAALAPAAHAQTDTMKVERPFRIKVGGYFPNDGDVKDSFGKNFVTAGLAYDFAKTKATTPVIFSGYFDYVFEKSRTENNVEGKLSNFGVGVAARFLFTPPTAPTGQPYAELGLGYYNVMAKLRGTVNGVNIDEDENTGRFGGKVALGYQLNNGLFGEFEYTLIDKVRLLGSDNFDPSGFKASIGYRF